MNIIRTLNTSVYNSIKSLQRLFTNSQMFGGTNNPTNEQQSTIPRPTTPTGITILSIIEHLTHLYPTHGLTYNFFPTDDSSTLVVISFATGNNVFPFLVNPSGQIQMIGDIEIVSFAELYATIGNFIVG